MDLGQFHKARLPALVGLVLRVQWTWSVTPRGAPDTRPLGGRTDRHTVSAQREQDEGSHVGIDQSETRNKSRVIEYKHSINELRVH